MKTRRIFDFVGASRLFLGEAALAAGDFLDNKHLTTVLDLRLLEVCIITMHFSNVAAAERTEKPILAVHGAARLIRCPSTLVYEKRHPQHGQHSNHPATSAAQRCGVWN